MAEGSDPMRSGLRPRRLLGGVVLGVVVAIVAAALLSDDALGALSTALIVLFCLLVVLYLGSLVWVTRTAKGRAARAAYQRRRDSE